MATVEITTESFGPTIEGNDIVIVDFWASWCQPCVRFAPTFEAASDKHDDIVFGKVDTEAQQQLAAEANITSIPTLMAFREKVLVFAQPGALNGTQLDSVIDAVKALDMKEVHAAVAAKIAEHSSAAVTFWVAAAMVLVSAAVIFGGRKFLTAHEPHGV